MNKNKNNQTIWNARIKKNTSTIFQKVGSSISIDKKLYKEDIAGSIAHVEMLFRQKIISKSFSVSKSSKAFETNDTLGSFDLLKCSRFDS